MTTHRQDPFFRQIILRLNGPLDANLFEECASDLLASEHPGLVPIPGGRDMGMDGAFPQDPEVFCPLVATIGENVIGNLTRSLNSYVDHKLPCRSVVVATSQSLSQTRRRNLIARAGELGFRLVQVHDQLKMANLLYRDPKWSEELLGLSGSPPPLSIFPMRSYHFAEIHIAGRHEELAWILEESGDRLLVGQPGIGKTFLLQKIALEGMALFVVSDDLAEIANAIREQQPRKLIVDDAHLNIDLLGNIRRLRDELGAEYSILASCWPHHKSDIEQVLGLSAKDTRELQRLTREDMVNVVKEMGLRRPDEHIAFILNQAEGRPGLAAVLVWAYLNGDWEKLNSGEAVVEASLMFLDRERRHKAKTLLAGFSLGGIGGMDFMILARELGESPADIRGFISELSSGGILFFYGQMVSVRPSILREALVKDVFFSFNPFPIDQLIDHAPSEDELALTLIGAKLRGGAVSDNMIIGILERCHTAKPWEAFCLLGQDETEWVIENHLEWLSYIAKVALDKVPDRLIPLLLQSSKGDHRALHSYPDHPLRQIADWIKTARPGSNEVIRRRKALLDTMNDWIARGEEPDLGIQVLEFAMSPEYEEARTDPGAGRTVTFYSGTVSLNSMQIISGWWNGIFNMLKTTNIADWAPIRRLLQAWSYPARLRTSPAKDIEDFMKSFACEMLEDIVSLINDRPGMLLWASQLANHLDLTLGIRTDSAFELLYGDIPRSEYEEWKEVEAERQRQISRLAKSWSKKDPLEIADRLLAFGDESLSISVRFPYRIRLLCSEIASAVGDPLAWCQAFHNSGLSGDLIAPFLDVVAERDIEEFVRFAEMHNDSPAVSGHIQTVVLRMANPPDDLLETVLRQLNRNSGVVESLTITGQISDISLTELLEHSDPAIAGAAALHEWNSEPEGDFRPEFRQMCRYAIAGLDASSLTIFHTQYQLERVLRADPSLAFEWINQRLNDDSEDYLGPNELLTTAASVLDPAQRKILISELPNSFIAIELAATLVGTNAELYRILLDTDCAAEVHLAPLSRSPSGASWFQMATFAQQKGYGVSEIAMAAIYQHGVTDASIDAWRRRAEIFDEMSADEDPFIREIGIKGKVYSEKRLADNELQDRLEQVYGF